MLLILAKQLLQHSQHVRIWVSRLCSIVRDLSNSYFLILLFCDWCKLCQHFSCFCFFKFASLINYQKTDFSNVPNLRFCGSFIFVSVHSIFRSCHRVTDLGRVWQVKVITWQLCFHGSALAQDFMFLALSHLFWFYETVQVKLIGTPAPQGQSFFCSFSVFLLHSFALRTYSFPLLA